MLPADRVGSGRGQTGSRTRWIETQVGVRFNEVDEWGLVWYGHYMAWFEVGRMAVLKRFDLLPGQMVELGYIAPVVNARCDYKQSAVFGDEIIVRTTVAEPEVAALNFKFQILRHPTRELLARGETTQVLLTTDKTMVYRLGGELESRIRKLVQHCQGR